MPEVKRGFRKVTMVIPVNDFTTLKKIAEENDREVGQQAAFMLKTGLQVHRANHPGTPVTNGEVVDWTAPIGSEGVEPVAVTE